MLLVVVVFFLSVVRGARAASLLKDKAYYEAKFRAWMELFEMNPLTDEAHSSSWLENFSKNDDHITTTNAKELTYTLAHNHFSHLSYDEWRVAMQFGLAAPDPAAMSALPRAVHPAPADGDASLPTAVDWVAKGAVTPVKNQGHCGSCWSFSTTGALEGAYYLKYGTLLSFSEQNLVDCDNPRHGGTDLGCNGGLMDNALAYVAKNGGLCTEEEYPYTSGVTAHQDLFCYQKKCTLVRGAAPRNATDVQPNSDAALMSAVSMQPVAIAIEADQRDFMLYKSGVYTATCGTNLDHGVLVVGYGVWEDGTKVGMLGMRGCAFSTNALVYSYAYHPFLPLPQYWKVKNSWSEKWGMGGYILLVRGIAQDGGECGILRAPSYPVL